MSKERQEKVADVVAAMRDESHAGDASCLEWVGEKMRSYADRIEAAAKHEREKNGNAATMREALEKVLFYMPHFLQYMRLHWEDAEAGGYYEKILEVINAALSAPPRNCDAFSKERIIEMLEDRSFSKEDTIEMALCRSERRNEMIINICDIEKVGITHAVRVAMGRINSSLATAFSTCHPDRHNMDWYRRVEDDIIVMK